MKAKTYSGLNKDRMASNAFFQDRVNFKKGDSFEGQFLTGIDGFMEYDIHAFQEKGKWRFIPCAGEDCPLCEDDDPQVSKTSYRACCNVWHSKEKKVMILEGPKDLFSRIATRYKRFAKDAKSRKKWTRTVFEISKFATSPISHDVEASDRKAVDPEGLKLHDLQAYVDGEMTRYYGSNSKLARKLAKKGKGKKKSSLDDVTDDEGYSKDELEEMSLKKLGKVATSVGVHEVPTKDTAAKVIKKILKAQAS